MAEFADVMEFALKPTGDIVVMVGEKGEASDFQGLLALVPDASARNWAFTINELEQGNGFEVIEDPAAYRSAFEAQLAGEDPGTGWQPGVMRLRDFGVPDFSQLAEPALSGTTLIYFARDLTTGLPYRVEAQLEPGSPAPEYVPMALTPLSDPPAQVEPVIPDDTDREMLMRGPDE